MENFINKEACTQCRLCYEVCPCHIYGINEKNEVYIIPERESICLACGQCMAICKPEAIQVDSLSYENDFFDLPEHSVHYKDFINFLSNRRSVRNFKSKPIPDEEMNKILDSIAFAPNGASPEKMNITVINNRAKIEESLPYFVEFLDNLVHWMESPMTSFLIQHRNKPETFNTVKNHLYPILKMGNYKLENGDRITRNAPALLIFHAQIGAEEHTNNSLIYATYAMLAAHSMGLGTTMIGIIPPAINRMQKLKRFFKIPADHEAVMSLIIGYPKYSYQKAIKRRSHKIHWLA
jgi:nitroreductase/NAD-dependent dihydropyrimidine dehydrogenase PreA subunit